MYRPRLRTKTGCLRCKQRHRKCDEARPKCRFCTAWNLECVRPGQESFERVRPAPGSIERVHPAQDLPQPTKVSNPRTKKTVASDKQSKAKAASRSVMTLVLSRSPSKTGSYLEAFHTIPIPSNDRQYEALECLQYFFVRMLADAAPYDIGRCFQQFATEWLELMHLDALVCSSFVTYCAALRARRLPHGGLQRLQLEFRYNTLSLLRQRIESGERVQEATLLAACLHSTWASLDMEDPSELSQICRGVVALVTAGGGYRQIEKQFRRGTMVSLFITDILNAVLNAEMPYFPPPSFNQNPSALLASISPPRVTNGPTRNELSIEMLDVLDKAKLALDFRKPSRWLDRLSKHESFEVFSLLNDIDHRLASMQARWLGSHSISEIVVLGMILVKQGVFADSPQHTILLLNVLQRLQSAISMCNLKGTEAHETAAMWASLMVLIGRGFNVDLTWFRDFILSTLENRFHGRRWPRHWRSDLRTEFGQILWHEKIEERYLDACHKFELAAGQREEE